jgi:hypothetical protein
MLLYLGFHQCRSLTLPCDIAVPIIAGRLPLAVIKTVFPMETLNKVDNAREEWSKPLIFRGSKSTIENYSASPYI